MCGGAGVMCGWRRTRGRWHTVEMKIRENAWIWATGGGRLQTAERDAATVGAGTVSISSLFCSWSSG
jgi:hypothetical protein